MGVTGYVRIWGEICNGKQYGEKGEGGGGCLREVWDSQEDGREYAKRGRNEVTEEETLGERKREGEDKVWEKGREGSQKYE